MNPIRLSNYFTLFPSLRYNAWATTAAVCTKQVVLSIVGVGGVLLSGSFSMCPTVECILCSENVYTAHCMKQ